MMVKKNTYIHKYKDPFVVKNLDNAMELLKRVIQKRKPCKLKKLYGCFVEDKVGFMELPQDLDNYYKYTGAICVTDKEIYAYGLDDGVLIPAIIDMLSAFWWSIKNDEVLTTDEIGLVVDNDKE